MELVTNLLKVSIHAQIPRSGIVLLHRKALAPVVLDALSSFFKFLVLTRLGHMVFFRPSNDTLGGFRFQRYFYTFGS